MTREKRNKIVFLIAIFGIILILITAVSVKIEKQSEEKTVMELKSTLSVHFYQKKTNREKYLQILKTQML